MYSDKWKYTKITKNILKYTMLNKQNKDRILNKTKNFLNYGTYTKTKKSKTVKYKILHL